MSCFPSKFARLANIGSVAKAKQSLEKKKRTGEIICQSCYMYKFKFEIDTTLLRNESELHHSYQTNANET